MAKKRKKAASKAKPRATRRGGATTKDEPEPKRPKLDLFDFSTEEVDPIIENLREVSRTYKTDSSLDDEILDQVALEGLTGLTLGRLCLILDAVIPNLNSCKDDKVQDYIWSVIVNRYMRRTLGAAIQVFHLEPPPPASRKDSPTKRQRDPNATASSSQNASSSQSSNRTNDNTKSFYIDKQISLPSHTLKRIAKSDWMLNPVQDGTIMGSCEHYLLRTNITQQILDSFDSTVPRQSLHDLNRQYQLKHVYLVADQELRRRMLLPPNYDPNMELKLREFACLELIGRTRCLGIVFPNDKTLGRYRILLTAKGLITQYQQTCNSYIIHHIRRFSRYNLEVAAKPFKDFGMTSHNNKTTSSANTRAQVDDEGEEEVHLDDDNGGAELVTAKSTCCHPRRLKSDRDMLKMVYDVIALSKGRSALDVRRKLKIPKSHVRNHLKNLANIELIGSHTRIIREKKVRVYRARYPSARRKLARKQKVALKGVRAKWDEIDLRARELLGYRRSHFSQAEDSLLILCRITCLLLEPNLRKLSFCVPKQLIRDTLHEECYESHDKTSDALLRRTKFLRHLSQNIMMINELTAELRDEPDIVRLASGRKEANSDEKLAKLFRQLLRSVRARLPHLLGLTSSSTSFSSAAAAAAAANSSSSGSLISGGHRSAAAAIQIKSTAELKSKFRLVDCQHSGGQLATGIGSASLAPIRAPPKPKNQCLGGEEQQQQQQQQQRQQQQQQQHPNVASSACLTSANLGNKSHQAPACALVQLAQPLAAGEARLELADCSGGMKSILYLASYCAATSSFSSPSSSSKTTSNSEAQSAGGNLVDLHLRVPVRVVGLDQDNENFKDIFERARESKETSRIIANLTEPSASNSADSRRALFMLRNALKLQTMDKCGKLADALIVQPCDIKFTSQTRIVFGHQERLLVEAFVGQVNEWISGGANNNVAAPVSHQGDQAATTTTTTTKTPERRMSSRCASRRARAAKGQQQQQPEGVVDVSEASTSVNVSDEQQSTATTTTTTTTTTKTTTTCDIAQVTRSNATTSLLDKKHLLKCVEALLAWISVYPGIEYEVLRVKMERHLVFTSDDRQLVGLLELMEKLQLISSSRLDLCTLFGCESVASTAANANTQQRGGRRINSSKSTAATLQEPRLFGYKKRLFNATSTSTSQHTTICTYEPQASAYIRYCQLINIDL